MVAENEGICKIHIKVGDFGLLGNEGEVKTLFAQKTHLNSPFQQIF